MRLILTLIFSTLTLISGAAHASPEKQAELKTIIDRGIEDFKKLYSDDIMELVADGETNVEDGGNFYAATTPFLKLIFDEDGVLNFGMVAINAVPSQSDPNRWNLTAALPTPIGFFSKDDGGNPQEIATLSLGKQSFKGVWDEALNVFVNSKGDYTDIALKLVNGQFGIDRVAMSTNLTPDGNNLWGGEQHFTISNLYGHNNRKNEDIKIGSIQLRSQVTGMDQDALKNIRENALKNLDFVKNADTTNAENPPVSPFLFENIFFDDMTASFKISDIVVPSGFLDKKDGAEGTNASAQPVNIGTYEAGIYGKSFKSNGAEFGVRFKTSELGDLANAIQARNTNAAQPVKLPNDFSLDLSLKGIPVQDFMAKIKDSMVTDADGVTIIDPEAIQAQMAPLLMGSGFAVGIQDISMNFDDSGISIKGEGKLTPSGSVPGIGTVVIDIFNMEGLMANLQMLASTQGESAAQAGAGAMSGAGMFMAMGRPAKDGKGRDILRYTIKVDNTGNLTLNDAPMMNVSGMAGAIPGQAPEQPAQ